MTTNSFSTIAPPKKSKSRQLVELLPSIEAALAVGYSHAAIFDHIQNTIGLDLTFRYYQLTLHRIRKKRDEAQAKVAPHALSSRLGSQPAPVALPSQRLVAQHDDGANKFIYDVKAPIHDFFS